MSMLSGRGASRRSLLTAFGAAAIGVSFSACSQPGAAPASGGEEPKLNFYNWDTYIGETTLADFKAANGVDVNMSLFATNDENLKNIDPSFMNPDYDPSRKMSVPYTWLVLGIGYRKSKVKGVPDSWKWLFDSDAYKGKIALLSESADLIRLAAKYKGHSVNNIPPEMIAEIEKMLIRQKPFVKAFHEDNGQDMLLSGEVDLVLEYNGDIAQIMTEDPDIGFVVPKEGSLINSDNLCIPVGAPRPNNAHAFINYLLDAEAGKKISETILYPTPNAAAKALMPESYRNNPAIFPPADVMAKCEYGAFEGAAKASLYEEVVTRVRAA